MTGPLPIHAWLVETGDSLILVDAGETTGARDTPFARFGVSAEDEIDRQVQAAGFSVADIDLVVLTHVHGDHIDGLPRLGGARVVISREEAKVVRSAEARMARRIAGQPLPDGFAPDVVGLDEGPVGGFTRSHRLADGVHAVATPGHTAGHMSVLVDQGDHHVLLAGDVAYDAAQLQALQVDGVSPKARVAVDTMNMVLGHARQHPTVFLPSHDPESAARLQGTVAL
jgi:glyoxylase-like metal-dependent hydrolase (beta-lactamase superfamily II)